MDEWRLHAARIALVASLLIVHSLLFSLTLFDFMAVSVMLLLVASAFRR